MEIIADLNRCQGYANCVVTAPEYFDLTDEGKVSVLRATVADGAEALVAEAVASCPAAALRLARTD